MKDKYDIVLAMFHGFDLAGSVAAPTAQKTAAVVDGTQHILSLPPDAKATPEDRKKRYLESCAALKGPSLSPSPTKMPLLPGTKLATC